MVFILDCSIARVIHRNPEIEKNNLYSTYSALISIYRCNLLIQSSKTSANASVGIRFKISERAETGSAPSVNSVPVIDA
jgi:hypothetical protein